VSQISIRSCPKSGDSLVIVTALGECYDTSRRPHLLATLKAVAAEVNKEKTRLLLRGNTRNLTVETGERGNDVERRVIQ
jgi:hypothetical protein